MNTEHATAEPRTLTVEEAAKVLRISRQGAYEAVRSGDLPAIRIGRRLLVPRARLDQMLGLNDDAPAGQGERVDTTGHGGGRCARG